MKVFAESIYYNLSINEVTSTVEDPQRKHIDKYGFKDNYMMSVICHTEYDLKNKTKSIIWRDYYIIHRGNKEITSNGGYKNEKLNKLIVIKEGEINNFVINTYPKMKITIFCRIFFMHIANNRDYVYNFCINSDNEFQRYRLEW